MAGNLLTGAILDLGLDFRGEDLVILRKTTIGTQNPGFID